MKTLGSLVLTVLVAMIATAATAAPTGKFAGADANKDKALTKVEACAGKTPRICKSFERIDANRDGSVTRAEIHAFRQAQRAAKGLPNKS